MSDMRKLLESMDKFAGEPEQKSGDQVRGTDNPKKSGKKHGFGGRLVGEGLDEFEQELMLEYRMFVEEPLNTAVAGNPTSPVANINPAGQGTTANNPKLGAGQTGQVGQQPGQPQQPGQTQQAGQTTTNPNQPQQPTQTPQQQAAQATMAKQELTTNLSGLKSLDPNLNVQKTVAALQKDPKMLGAADAQALGQMANTLEPILQNKAAAGSLKSTVQRLVK
jgi:hypothetical protein